MPQTARASVLDTLRRQPVASDYSATAMTLVMAIRLIARCAACQRDPLVELSCRLESLTGAKAALDFAKACSLAWPEKAMVGRPCCHGLTPDESVFAGMAEAARAADSEAFSGLLDGLIRRERHDRLFTETQHAVAILAATPRGLRR
ncbi:hypothetical protein [Aurantiacibacter hainanensis]|uniref:hypothetical protein n=1 Tax=Aurantiacibacter hainanensis TaxID=3076114 RepID=UPI0030C6C876